MSSSDVDQVLARLAETNRSYTPKEADAVAGAGDSATVNFTGTIDGESFEGGSGQDVDVVLGSGNFLPGFEAQVAGMRTGERRTIAAIETLGEALIYRSPHLSFCRNTSK